MLWTQEQHLSQSIQKVVLEDKPSDSLHEQISHNTPSCTDPADTDNVGSEEVHTLLAGPGEVTTDDARTVRCMITQIRN